MFSTGESGLILPSYSDYEVLKHTFLHLGQLPDARVRENPEIGSIYIHYERLFVDLDFLVWPPLTICLTGFVRVLNGHEKMVLRYREITHNQTTQNSSVNHDYIFGATSQELTEFGHSVRGCPEVPEQRQEIFRSDTHMEQADLGRQILQINFGNQLEISAGDCGVLFDRMSELSA